MWSDNINYYENKTDLIIFILLSVIFLIIGIIQILCGVFYFVSISLFKLLLHVCVGLWAVLCGIGNGVVASVYRSSSKKYELLFYISISLLAINTVNAVLIEVEQLNEFFQSPLGGTFRNKTSNQISKRNSVYLEDARLISTVTTITCIILAFIQSQITFCCLNKIQRNERNVVYRRGRNHASTETIDQEYVLEKRKSSAPDVTIQMYTKSWVFDKIDDDIGRRSSLVSSVSTNSIDSRPGGSQIKHKPNTNTLDPGTGTFMSSFSRPTTPTPMPPSVPATPCKIIANDYYEPSTFIQSCDRSIPTVPVTVPTLKRMTSITKCSDEKNDNQFASLLAELEKSLEKKYGSNSNNSTSGDANYLTDNTDNDSHKEFEFSEELEKALQIIQDIETPSEDPSLKKDDSDQTLCSESHDMKTPTG